MDEYVLSSIRDWENSDSGVQGISQRQGTLTDGNARRGLKQPNKHRFSAYPIRKADIKIIIRVLTYSGS